MEGESEARRRPRRTLSGPLGKSALASAAIAAAAYATGSGYLEAHYTTLGLDGIPMPFAPGEIMRASLLPLFVPVFFCAMLAVFCLTLRQRQLRRPVKIWPNPFRPIPLIQAITLVWGFWTLKVLSDLLLPPADVIWLAWRRRHVLFVLVASGVAAYLYMSHRALEGRPLWAILRGRSATLFGLYATLLSIVGFAALAYGRWPLVAWQTVLFMVSLAYVCVIVFLDVKAFVRRKRPRVSEPADPATLLTGRDASSTVFLSVVFAMAFILAGSIPGTLAAREKLQGCDTFTRVQFDPMPRGIDENATLWLVAFWDGLYYVRAVPPPAANTTNAHPLLANATYVVRSHDLLVVQLERAAPWAEC